MKYFVQVTLLLVLLSSCAEPEKEYRIEIRLRDNQGIFGPDNYSTEDKIIRATNDSVAYYEGYKTFRIKQHTRQVLIERNGRSFSDEPSSFAVYNEDGQNIFANLSSETREKIETGIDQTIERMN